MVCSVGAQEKAILYSHHGFNGLAMNPAYSGSHEMLSIGLSHRSQWIGFEGAPAYNIVNLHTPLRNTQMGLGILVMNESIGLRKNTGFYLNYAHRLNLGPGKLALGLKAGVSAGSYEKIDLGNDDYIFNENTDNFMLPNFGFGLYYYTTGFYAGLSVPLILGYETNAAGEVVPYHDFSKYAYYFTTGVKARLSDNWKIHPSALLEYDQGSGLIADGGISFMYKDVLRAGASYRNKGAIVMIMDYRITYQLKVGFAYDYGFKGINEYNRSSVEVAIEYNFGYRIRASNPTIF
ncbi:MAG: type IX secretion system membrane protein PorP/SprF [Bacteroidales bacterium]|nr:type IX secretion system membrane protein PorP/SprF [Bacteroidales bacterium]